VKFCNWTVTSFTDIQTSAGPGFITRPLEFIVIKCSYNSICKNNHIEITYKHRILTALQQQLLVSKLQAQVCRVVFRMRRGLADSCRSLLAANCVNDECSQRACVSITMSTRLDNGHGCSRNAPRKNWWAYAFDELYWVISTKDHFKWLQFVSAVNKHIKCIYFFKYETLVMLTFLQTVYKLFSGHFCSYANSAHHFTGAAVSK